MVNGITRKDRRIVVVSYYDFAVYDPAEHIVGFFSSSDETALALNLFATSGFDHEFHSTSRTIQQLTRWARYAQKEESVHASKLLGYGQECQPGHMFTYPWSHCYMVESEIADVLDDVSFGVNLLRAKRSVRMHR